MTDIIKLLPDSVANQIAAGEVIQRPASVVKELMENSVDSGAKNISVIIKDSGKTLIQVIDDGCGMSETDARLSFERHATSKITCAGDLFSISTKGFRGEALASIAAVAMVELRTRKDGADTGTHIIISGSKVESQEPCSCPAGSNFSVKSLFFNIPARRKFLKSDQTEFRHIVNEFQKVVIPHPDIKFTLSHNDTEVYNLPGGNLRQRIVGVFGKQLNPDLITLETDTSLVAITGFIGKPESARRTFGEQFFFVNNRFMKHPYFHKAVAEAYQNILPPDMVPIYFIFMETDPASIDINIHPTKTEIKFEDERAIWQILMASVREALGRFNIIPSLDFENESLIDIPVRNQGDPVPRPPEIEINPAYDPFNTDMYTSGSQGSTASFERGRFDHHEKTGNRGGNENSPLQAGSFDFNRKFIQVRNKYILCPVKSGLMLIDQKRAHERILYESFLQNLTNNRSASQTVLFPVEIELNPGDISILEEIKDDLKYLGFNIMFPGNNIITVTGLPSGFGISPADPVETLRILVSEYRNTMSDPAKGAKERLAASMAAATAITYGKTLSQTEMEDLFDNLFACTSPNYSPGGKPVITIITAEDIDKKF